MRVTRRRQTQTRNQIMYRTIHTRTIMTPTHCSPRPCRSLTIPRSDFPRRAAVPAHPNSQFPKPKNPNLLIFKPFLFVCPPLAFIPDFYINCQEQSLTSFLNCLLNIECFSPTNRKLRIRNHVGLG